MVRGGGFLRGSIADKTGGNNILCHDEVGFPVERRALLRLRGKYYQDQTVSRSRQLCWVLMELKYAEISDSFSWIMR